MNTPKFDGPLFIIGNPRSGTSLLRLILTSHSQILIPPECGFIIWLHKKYEKWKVLDNNDTSRKAMFLDDLLKCKKFDTWSLDIRLAETLITGQQPKNYAELCSVVYAAYGISIGKIYSIWGDKNNFHIHYLDELQCLYEKARFLHIVRDGRDILCSYREVMAAKSKSPYAPNFSTNVSEVASEWSNNVMNVDAFMALKPPDIAMTIRYEDLVLDPTTSINSICDWLSLSYEVGMLNFYQQNIIRNFEPNITLDWKKRTLQPISDDTVGRYVNLLKDDEQREFLSIAENALHCYSYV